MSYHILETVKAALQKDDQQYLQVIEADLKKRTDDVPKRTVEDLLSAVNNTSFFLGRNFAAESTSRSMLNIKQKRFVQP